MAAGISDHCNDHVNIFFYLFLEAALRQSLISDKTRIFFKNRGANCSITESYLFKSSSAILTAFHTKEYSTMKYSLNTCAISFASLLQSCFWSCFMWSTESTKILQHLPSVIGTWNITGINDSIDILCYQPITKFIYHCGRSVVDASDQFSEDREL